MTASVQSVLLFGFGNGTVNGSTGLVVTLGFGVPELVATITGPWSNVIACQSWQPRIAAHKTDRIESSARQERIEANG